MCTGDVGAHRRAQRNPEALSKLHWSFLTMRRKRANFEQGNEQLMTSEKNTYVSLFSCAGIGCYGFMQAGWECLATCELKPSYMAIQKANDKCASSSRYICGDISERDTKDRIFTVVNEVLSRRARRTLDIVMATPPCQGISLANHKKNIGDFERIHWWLMRL